MLKRTYKKHKIIKKHQRNGKKKTDWNLLLNIIQTVIAFLNLLFK